MIIRPTDGLDGGIDAVLFLQHASEVGGRVGIPKPLAFSERVHRAGRVALPDQQRRDADGRRPQAACHRAPERGLRALKVVLIDAMPANLDGSLRTAKRVGVLEGRHRRMLVAGLPLEQTKVQRAESDSAFFGASPRDTRLRLLTRSDRSGPHERSSCGVA